ncbi:hypothetical protein DSO57_1000528 [Entomophthora muscae]|uniref:Uncharacterized protein n=1 Tax=Entomophthora muscae TaxID=34485 RepID=A0ACC2RP53_9FUNG|nr:hypothetical protein DSO57_1000528 [Entomophthora muscae]
MDFSLLGPSAKRYFSDLMPQEYQTSTREVGSRDSASSSEGASEPRSAASRFYNFYSDSSLGKRLSNPSPKTPKASPKPPISEIQLNLSDATADKFVLVPDILSFGELEIQLPFTGKPYRLFDYWGKTKSAIPSATPVHPSAVGSLHDRACEIFFELKGGRVDYGKEHSRKFCHSQLGTHHPGLMPEWDGSNPIVLIGKGYGAQTCLYLQYLLATNFFKCNTSASWIKGIVSVEGSLSGSTLPYLWGLLPGTKTVIHPFSFLQFFLGFLHFLLWLDHAPILRLLDLVQMEHWSLSQKAGASLWSALFGRSQFAYFEDNFFHDYSVEGALWYSKLYHLSPKCIYLNYIGDSSVRSRVSNYHLPRLSNWRYFFTGLRLGRATFSSEIELRVLGGESSAGYWENNGYLPVKSQLPPAHHTVRFNMELGNKILDPILYPLLPGIWHNVYFHNSSALRIMQPQEQFYNYSSGISWAKFTASLDASGVSFMEKVESFLNWLQAFSPLTLVSILFTGYTNNGTDPDIWNKGFTPLLGDGSDGDFEKTDAIGRAWARDTETRAFLQSPSSIIRWMNHSPNSDQKTSNQLSLDSYAIRQALESRNDCPSPKLLQA